MEDKDKVQAWAKTNGVEDLLPILLNNGFTTSSAIASVTQEYVL